MLVQFTRKRDNVAINPDRILFCCVNGKYSRIFVDDGTPIDVNESLDEVCEKCNVNFTMKIDENQNMV